MSRFRILRRRSVAVVAGIVVFLTALVLWAGPSVGSDSVGAAPTPSLPIATTTPSPSAGSSPASGAQAQPALVDLAASDDPTGPAASSLPVAGTRRVTLTATAADAIGVVRYRFADREVHTANNVEHRLSVSARIGPTQRAVIVVQVSPDGGTARCAIAVNGVVRVRQSVTGAYEVTACVL